MLEGILQLPWWSDLLCVLLATHLTIVYSDIIFASLPGRTMPLHYTPL